MKHHQGYRIGVLGEERGEMNVVLGAVLIYDICLELRERVESFFSLSPVEMVV